MRLFLRAVAAWLAAMCILSLSGCGGSADARVYFELNSRPATLDPQTASTDAELMLVRNLFEGLLRKNADGAIVPAAAERFTVDGMTYTFYLRKDLLWENGDPLTASDFVFGFYRAVRPDTRCPFAFRLFCIEGAEAVNEGRADIGALAVTADGDYTLRITLCTADADFLETLTTSPCMPCSEAFFERCVGKYGLEKQYLLSNGSYNLSKWDQQTFGIRIYRNRNYRGVFEAKNGGVFFSCSDTEDALARLAKNSVDAAFLDGDAAKKAEETGFSVLRFTDTCWVLTLSPDFPADLRRALLMLVDGSVYADDLPDGCVPADSLFPPTLSPDPSVSGAGITGYAREGAKRLFTESLSSLPDRKFPRTVLTYCNDGGMKPAVTDIVAHWQQNLSAFVNIEAADHRGALLSELTEPSLQLALFPVTAANTSVSEYLRVFGVDDLSPGLDAVQTALLASHRIVPIAFEDTCIACSSALSGLCSEAGNGYLDFSFVVKQGG